MKNRVIDFMADVLGMWTETDDVIWDGERASELYAFVRRPEA